MHLKHIRQFTTSIPRSLGEGITLPEGFVFTDATPSPSMLLNGGGGGGSGNTPMQITNGDLKQANFSSSNNNGSNASSNMSELTISSNFSQISPADAMNGHLLFGSSSGLGPGHNGSNNGPSGGGSLNPLHGLGLNVEQYPSLLQNLLGMSGDALDAMEFDSSLLGDRMLGGPGESIMSSFGAVSVMSVSTAMNGSGADVSPSNGSTSQKRPREDEDPMNAAKRSRFEIVD